jgi:hypothetical protein
LSSLALLVAIFVPIPLHHFERMIFLTLISG